MILPPQHELFVSERPVRSDYSRERVYARRRVLTVIVLGLVLAGTAYAFFGHGPSNPADIPTIAAEGPYKQKPTDPGGIDIPHQDVQVYDQLESRNGIAPSVEHLLPPPEVPKDVPHAEQATAAPPPASAPAQTPIPTPATDLPPTLVSAPVVAVAPVPAPNSVPVPAVVAVPPKADILQNESNAKPVNTTVAPVAVPSGAAPVAANPTKPQALATPKAASLSIDQVINETSPKPTAAAAPVPAVIASIAPKPAAVPPVVSSVAPKATALTATQVKGKVAIQLAALPNQAQASSLATTLQQKYASQLGSTKLRVVRADLGNRGIYYRIQSQLLSDVEASRVCSSLKQINAGCLIVGK